MNTERIADAVKLIDKAEAQAFEAAASARATNPQELERYYQMWLKGQYGALAGLERCFIALREVQNACALAKLELSKVAPVEAETNPEWVAVADRLPPEGLVVETKIHVTSWHPWGLIKRTYKAGTWLTVSEWKDTLPLPTHWHEIKGSRSCLPLPTEQPATPASPPVSQVVCSCDKTTPGFDDPTTFTD